MFEVGKTYTAVNGEEYECIAVLDGWAWLKSSPRATAYVWDKYGFSVSLSEKYNITFDPRDQEIADLKTRIAVLTAIVRADEYDTSRWLTKC